MSASSEKRSEHEGNPGLARRDWLKMLGAAGVGLATAPAAWATDDLREQARANLMPGIMSSVYADLPVDEAARRIKADGFTGVVTDFAFADVRFNPLEPDWTAAGKVLAALERNGVEVVGLFGYYNLVDPDRARRKLGAARMETLLTNWKR